ncbi:MAG: glutamyl/glutaminyl-tRNA synthetase, partial [Kiritimatiellia bacterium]
MTARTRFAPSPTGSLHVGGARTALYCLLHAHHEGGEFILRIEDTDRARSTQESTRGILRDMRWLGLLWDEGPEMDKGRGPYLQSQRLHVYGPHFDELLASGHAYEAWETREELGAMRTEAQKAKRNFRYQRIPYSTGDLERFVAEGRIPVLRLAHPTHDVTVNDKILGDVTLMESELEDIVIRKADG